MHTVVVIFLRVLYITIMVDIHVGLIIALYTPMGVEWIMHTSVARPFAIRSIIPRK